tara:strand:+ start:558 stop:692 length:135 start_codon:yes stop_codon:yes gene_type:complete
MLREQIMKRKTTLKSSYYINIKINLLPSYLGKKSPLQVQPINIK